jgi:hypothetical protein
VAATALAASGPFAYAVLGALNTLVKLGTGFGPSVRGQVYAHTEGVLQRLVVEGGSALFSLDGAAGLWVGAAGSKVLVRESTMKAGVFVAFSAADLSPAGVVVQTASEEGGEESKGAEAEASSKAAASGTVTASSGGFIGLGATALALTDEKTLLVRLLRNAMCAILTHTLQPLCTP